MSTSAHAENKSGAASAPAAGEVAITEKAREHFRAGVSFLQDPDGAQYEEAYAQFKAAYAESPSWKILNNFGISAMKLEKDGEAIEAFEKYLSVGGDQITAEEREQTTRDLQTLKASVVTLTLTASQSGSVLVDERVTNRGETVVNRYSFEGTNLTIRVRPGEHKLIARVAGYNDSVWELSASAASSHEHAFLVEKPAEVASGASSTPEDGKPGYRPVPTSVWIGVGLTGAFVAGSVVTGLLALGKTTTYEQANANGDPKAEDLRSSVKTMNLVTDVLIGGAVASGIVTSILYLTRPTVPSKTALRLEPLVGSQVVALRFSGEF
jgi:hypothetical protein